MALIAIGIALFAFVPEYLASAHGRFPIAWVLHVHGAIMASWVAIYLVQAYLGATRRIGQHRAFGNVGIAIGGLAWVSMLFVEWRSLIVHPPPADIRAYDWLLPGPYVYLTFPVFLALGYRTRRRPDWHKRFLTFALFLSLQAAIQRFLWIPADHGYWPFAAVLDFSLLVPLAWYDLKDRKGNLHPATVRGTILLLAAQMTLFLLWGTPLWRNFARSVTLSLSRS